MRKAPVARNLLKEVEDDRQQKLQPAVGRKRPRQDDIDDDHDLYIHADHLERTPGKAEDVYVNAVVIQISDEAYNAAKQTSNSYLHEALSWLPGVYYMVGVWEKKPVFKQEAYPDQVNNNELMLFYSEQPRNQGWHFVDKIFWNSDTYNKTKVIALGVGDDYPTEVIAPFWEAHTLFGVTCTPLAEYQQEQILKLESKIADLESDNAVLRDSVDAKLKDKKPGHGGWLPKCSKLLSAFYNHNNKRLKILCDEYYAFSPTLKQLVDENVKRAW